MQKKDKVSRSSDNYLTCLMNPGHLWGWKKIIANRECSNKLEKSKCNPGLETTLATATANFLVISWASGCLSVCTLSSQLLCLTPGCPFSPTCFPHFICQRSFPGRKPTLVTEPHLKRALHQQSALEEQSERPNKPKSDQENWAKIQREGRGRVIESSGSHGIPWICR